MNKKALKAWAPIVIAFLVLLGFSVFEYTKITSLTQDLKDLSVNVMSFEEKTASTTAEIQASISDTRTTITTGLNQQSQNVGAIEQRLQQQVGSVTGTLNTLQKLSKTDPQLLAKYSKVFFLNENYAPERLTAVPNDDKYSDAKAVSMQSDVWPHLKTLIDDAKKAGVTLYVSSGYRSFAEQKNLKSDYRVTYGAGTANQFSADQGYSEHQLGTALDFTTTGIGGGLDGFDGTPAYPWLQANAYKYGFILSYPKGNTDYVFEPWHWRYVGVKLATDLHNQGKTFYDLDQRTIDTYLVNIFD